MEKMTDEQMETMAPGEYTTWEKRVWRRGYEAALAQQPAAVDGAAMQDIADAAAALDKRGDRKMASRLMNLHTRLLAAQPGGSDNE